MNETPPEVHDGYLELNDRPGLGLGQFLPEAIAQSIILELECSHGDE